MVKLPIFLNIADDDPDLVIKSTFNSFSLLRYEKFVEAVQDLADGVGTRDQYAAFLFPDPDDLEPFEGVLCLYLDDEQVVSEETFFSYLKLACEKYAEKYPESRDELQQLINEVDSKHR